LSLSLPPAGIGPLAFVALVPLLWLVRDARPRRGLLLGLAFGLAFFGTLLYWIFLFGALAWGALTTVMAAFVGVFGLLAPLMWRSERPVRSLLGLAALWTAIEWARSLWPLGGFAWGELGVTQAGNRFLLPLASVTGVWGITTVVFLVNGLLLLAVDRAAKRRGGAVGEGARGALGFAARQVVAPVVGCIALVFAPALIRIPAPNGPPLDVAAIQVDVLRARGLAPAAQDQMVADMNAAQQLRLVSDPPDLAVWGEAALDPGATSDPVTLGRVRGAIRAVGAPTLSGAVTEGADGRQRTEALLFNGRAELVDRYAKVHLVPFGEYVPWRKELGFISALRQIPIDRTPGPSVHTVQTPGLPPFGTPICYENSFPELDRQMVIEGAQFLVVTIDNASYEYTAASRQHLEMSRLRAVENARWVVHAAVSGISAFIDPTGRVVGETGLFQTTILRHEIRASTAKTLYTRLGDWVPWLSLTLALALLLAPRSRLRRQPPPDPLPERPRILVILPTYNERGTIEPVIRGLLALEDGVDVLVVDDGSPDKTAELVRGVAAGEPRVRLVERPAKAGLASAYFVGFHTALGEGYDLAVEMDSDLSHQPQELPRLLAAARDHHLVIGSRYVPGGAVTNWSRARIALSKGGNLYARIMLGIPLRDATSGFRVFRKGLLAHLVAEPIRSDGYGFQIELALRSWRDGYSVGEAPITFREREHGQSKISRRIVIEALWLVTVWGIKGRLLPWRLPSGQAA